MPTVKLVDLNPDFQGFPITGNVIDLHFDCPVCGKPYRQHLQIRKGYPPDAEKHIWNYSVQMGDKGKADLNTLSIQPSFDFTHPNRHGHGHPCTFHGTLQNGVIQYP